MKIAHKGLIGTVLISAVFMAGNAQAVVKCYTGNLAGNWSVSYAEADGVGYCPKVNINKKGYINASKSSLCRGFTDDGTDSQNFTIKLLGGRLQLKSDCSMKTGSLRVKSPEGKGTIPVKAGRMAKDKGSIKFFGVEKDGWSIVFDGIKAP